MSRRVRMPAILALILLLVAVATGILVAAPATKKVRVEAKQIVSEKKTGTIRYTTFSTARVYQDDATFTADTILARSENDVHEFTCTGNPVFTDPENKITALKVIAYSTPRRAEFIDKVKMVSTPKKKDGTQGDVRGQLNGEPSTTTCDRMNYDYASKRAEAIGNVVVVQKARTVWADKGVYDQSLELITLTGNVRMRNTGEEEIKEMKDAAMVTVSLENDWVDIVAKEDGFVTLILDVKDDEPAPKATDKKDAPKADGKK